MNIVAQFAESVLHLIWICPTSLSMSCLCKDSNLTRSWTSSSTDPWNCRKQLKRAWDFLSRAHPHRDPTTRASCCFHWGAFNGRLAFTGRFSGRECWTSKGSSSKQRNNILIIRQRVQRLLWILLHGMATPCWTYYYERIYQVTYANQTWPSWLIIKSHLIGHLD